MKRRRALWMALAIGLFAFAWRAPLMDLPLERDEGEYAYVGWRLGHGEVPYRDWFDQKPPGAFVAYAAALELPGDPIVAIRAVAASFAALACAGLFFAVRPELGTAAAVLAAVLLALLSADPMLQGPIANTEVFMMPGIVWGAAFFLRVARSPRSAVASSVAVGALLGVATAFKQVAAVNAPFFLLVLPFAVDSASRWRRTLGFAVWMSVGGLLVWAPILGWLALHGALGEALDALVWHNLDYAGAVPASLRLAKLANNAHQFLPSQAPAWAMAGVGLAVLARRREPFPTLFFGGWALANAVGVSASGHYFPHYFQQLLPCVAALAGAALGRSPSSGRSAFQLRDVLVCGLAVVPVIAVSVPFWWLSPAQATERIYPGNTFELVPEIAVEIASITDPDDRVFVFGAEPQLLFYARRVSASRYIHLFPLFGPYADARERQREVAEEIDAVEPAVIVWAPNAMFFGPDRPRDLIRRVRRLLRERYHPYVVVVREPGTRGMLIRVPEDEEDRQRILAMPIAKSVHVRIEN